MRTIRSAIAIASCAFGICLTASGAEAASRLELTPCAKEKQEGLPADARCGIYEVWENRDAKKGRKIPLQVVVLRGQEHQVGGVE